MDEFLSIKQELFYMRSPRDVVIQKWIKTSKKRINEITKLTDSSLETLFKEWPLYIKAQ